MFSWAKMKLFTRAALILAFVGCATSLKCYTCTDGVVGQPETPECRDTFDKDLVHPSILKADCTNISLIAPEATAKAGITQYNTCMKAMGGNTISRTCFDNKLCPVQNGCYSEEGTGTTVCCCNTDYCNEGIALTFNLAVISAVAFAAFSLTA